MYDSRRMKTLYTTIFAAVGVCLSMAGSALGLEGWVEDFSQGMETARAENRTALVEFTGTDWCHYCILLRKNVLPTDEFKEYANKNNLVLIELDFPSAQDKVTPEQRAAREEVAKRYGVQGYPTVLVMDGYGQVYARVEGGAANAKAYIARLQKGLDVKAAYDAKIAEANKLTGAARVAALQEALNLVPENSRKSHTKLVDDIIQSDPDDATGLRTTRDSAALLDKQVAELKSTVNDAMAGRKLLECLPEVRSAVLDLLKRDDLLPYIRLSIYAFVSQTYISEQNFAEALKYMDAAIAASPDSEEAEVMRKGRVELEELVKLQAQQEK